MAKLSRKAFLAELDRVSPDLAAAFQQAIDDVKSTAQLSAIEGAIERGDIEGAISALRLGPDFFAPFDDAIGNAFRAGAIWQLSGLPKKTLPTGSPILAVRFQGRHPRAEAWVREASSRLIVEVLDDQRAMVREVVGEALAAGKNPRATALDIIGRVDRKTGRRSGGVVGLTSQQGGWVQNMRAELSDPETASGYFDRKRRDKRFDPTVRKAIREGRPVKASDIDKIAGRYSDSLLQLRGETIARTETLRALNAGREEGINQIIDTGEIRADQVTKKWDASGDSRVRDSHSDMDGQTVQHNEAFTTSSGAQMMFPGDTSLGAPGEETIQCRCYYAPKIDFLAGLRAEPQINPLPPQFQLRDVPKARTTAEAERIATDMKISSVKPNFKGADVDGLNEILTTSAEIDDRFGMASLSYLGNSKTAATKGRGLSESPRASGWFGFKNNVMGLGKTGSRKADLKELSALADDSLSRASAVEKRKIRRSNISDVDILSRLDRLGDEWTYTAIPASPRQVILHENGHRFHANYWKSVESVLSDDHAGWAELLGEYATVNKFELVAESFALYIERPDQRWRLHPGLLSLFIEKDAAS